MKQEKEEPIDIVPPDKLSFITYNIWVCKPVQKCGGLITNRKSSSEVDLSKIAQLPSEAIAFYDDEWMILQLINAILRSHYHSTKMIINVL